MFGHTPGEDDDDADSLPTIRDLEEIWTTEDDL